MQTAKCNSRKIITCCLMRDVVGTELNGLGQSIPKCSANTSDENKACIAGSCFFC